MDFINHTSNWVKGDIFQGRVMLSIGILLLITAFAILKSNHTFLKGSLIPLGLAITILIGYGSFLAFSRSEHLVNVKTEYIENNEKAIQQEYEKAAKDNKAYSTLKPIWVILITISSVLFYFCKTDYLKGLSVGLIGLFLIALIIDSLLHHRLKPYFEILSSLQMPNK